VRRTLPKKLIRLLPVQDHKDYSYGELLTGSQVHANDRVGVLAMAAQQREEAKSNSIDHLRDTLTWGLPVW
jgi:hypothetical protein